MTTGRHPLGRPALWLTALTVGVLAACGGLLYIAGLRWGPPAAGLLVLLALAAHGWDARPRRRAERSGASRQGWWTPSGPLRAGIAVGLVGLATAVAAGLQTRWRAQPPSDFAVSETIFLVGMAVPVALVVALLLLASLTAPPRPRR